MCTVGVPPEKELGNPVLFELSFTHPSFALKLYDISLCGTQHFLLGTAFHYGGWVWAVEL